MQCEVKDNQVHALQLEGPQTAIDLLTCSEMKNIEKYYYSNSLYP